MNEFVWPSDFDRAESDELNRVCEYAEELWDEVERLRADNDHQRERRNAARDAIEKGKAERKAIEQERDQLTVHIQRIDTLAWKFLTYPNEAQTLEDLNRALSNSPVQNIAQHDAEVIEHETQRCIEAVEAEPEYPDEAPPELMKYINQCIENKDADHMLHMMRHSVRLTKSEIINRIRGLPTQQAKVQPVNDSCQMECGAYGTYCRCRAEKAEEV